MAETRHFEATYELFLRGILFGRADLRVDISEADIRLNAHVQSAGIAKIVSGRHFASSASARRENGLLVPTRLDTQWIADNEVKKTWLDYADGVPIEFVSGYVPPPDEQRAEPVAFDIVGTGSQNPFLTLLAPLRDKTLASVCARNIKLFDGRRLARLSSTEADGLPVGTPPYPFDAPVQACSVSWQPLGGYSSRSLARAEEFKPVNTFWAQLGDTDFAAPVEINGKTRFGALSVRATAFFVETAQPRQPVSLDSLLKSHQDGERRGRRRRFN